MRSRWQWLRSMLAPSTEASTLVNVAKAIVAGSEREAASAAERWAQARLEQEEREAWRTREQESAREIQESLKRDGVWFPPSHSRIRWERFR